MVQPARPIRITDYTVPFGAFGGLGAQGFSLTAANFSRRSGPGRGPPGGWPLSFSPVLATTAPFETFFCASAPTATCNAATTLDLKFEMRAAALDTTNDGQVNYDTLVFFECHGGIWLAVQAPVDRTRAMRSSAATSAPFFFEGSGTKVGAAYFVSHLAPDLSTVRFARYGANFIPRNAPVLTDVDDINNTIGFWRPQADFRIPERMSPGFTSFPDIEIEAMFEDMVKTLRRYQADIGERAILTQSRRRSRDGLYRAAGRLRASVPAHRPAPGAPTRRTRTRSGPIRTQPRSPATSPTFASPIRPRTGR